MKTCARCKVEKAESQFTKASVRKSGLNPYCLECTRFLGREYYSKNKAKTYARTSQWKKLHPESGREASRQWRIKNIEKFRAIKRKAYNANKVQITAILRDNAFRRKFGISLIERDHLAKSQGGRCSICGKHESELDKRLAVDHDHRTKTIRGLLCQNCNNGLGHFLDDPDLLRSAIDYLERMPDRKEESA